MRCWDVRLALGAISMVVATIFVASAAAQNPRTANVELCNGKDRSSPDFQIQGCTALIEGGQETSQTLAIVYNNRGNAYTEKGEYDHAIADYNQSIKFNRGYARAYNNRGVAYQKKGEYDRALEEFTASTKLNPPTRADISEDGSMGRR